MSTSVAERMWAAQIEMGLAEEAACDAILEAAGFDRNKPDTWPFDDTTYDNYDESFELKDATPDWEPSVNTQSAWWALGFSQCWVCYKGGGEKHYCRPRVAA